ncbi:hypothetical protein Enr13x_21630 [Stieleria neptunia]|uniref:Planctomycete cytochrome C n=1 Tax=Stieleria neptunia TaxID=2527979 RepID=A0A518HN84_9BACT|nr:DUF1592 domain-containing protein [Stieleria neptunia]QDV42318.1 hypothetical protein Enr13x_21630 [Stieleria neptunia]
MREPQRVVDNTTKPQGVIVPRSNINGLLVAFLLAVFSQPSLDGIAGAEDSPRVVMPNHHGAFFQKYCLDCHDAQSAEGNVDLETLSFDLGTLQSAEQWQKILNALNSGEMPPEDERQATDEDKTAFLETLSKQLVAARRLLADTGGQITMRRLNRREYENSIEVLLGIKVDAGDLPDDANPGGFDTAGGSLFFSSDQFEQYLKLARTALDQAIVTSPKPKIQTRRIEVENESNRRVQRLYRYHEKGFERWEEWQASGGKSPTEFGFADDNEAAFRKLGWDRNGADFAHYLAREETQHGALLTVNEPNPQVGLVIPDEAPPGQYRIRARIGVLGDPDPSRTFIEIGFRGERIDSSIDLIACRKVNAPISDPEIVEVLVDIPILKKPLTVDVGVNTGKRVDIGERVIALRQRMPNVFKTGFALRRDSIAKTGANIEPALWIDWVEWEGPMIQQWPPASTQAIFFDDVDRAKDADYARAIIERFAKRAFRIKEADPEFVDRLTGMCSSEMDSGKRFEEAIKLPLSLVLASPGFLYLREPASDPVPRDLSGEELAVRLSYFLWSSPPDDELLAAARAGELTTAAGLARQTSRLLDDERAMEFVSGFTHQWLQMERLDFFQFNPKLYPEFDASVKLATRQEVYATIGNLIRSHGPIGELLKSDTILINDLLADYYGISDVHGPAFREVTVPDGMPRGGLLGMAAILAMGSDGERSSPVERGAWVMRKLLHDPPPPAPANVPQLSRLAGESLPARQLLEAHMEESQCAQCHRKIDPIGYGLEHFNAVGLWRKTEQVMVRRKAKEYPIDDAGTLPDGTEFQGFFELRDRIAEREAMFARGFVENLIEYALGRPYGFTDQDLSDAILTHGEQNGRTLNTYLHALVQSKAFQQK